MSHNIPLAYDDELVAIADYVMESVIDDSATYLNAHWCVWDALGCALRALNYPACTRLLGPSVEGTMVPHGARVLGTQYSLDPERAAFNLGAMIRWLDFNDTWLAAEWGHPSDNLGAILPVADYLSQQRRTSGQSPLTMHTVLTSLIKAYEIQGILALENAFNRVGLDHVMLVKIASTAVVTALLGGDKDAVLRALSQAWLDGQSLRTYRHAPNAGSRKSWAAGDAASRAVQLARLSLRGEMGYPRVLTTPTWGFYDASFRGQAIMRDQPYDHYVIDNILFKLHYPAEFHAQTAVEAAVQLHPKIKNRLDDIERIVLTTQESAMRIINKTGPLNNPADRDHCLQYMVAIGLLFGDLTADHYDDAAATDPRIDDLRNKMDVSEDVSFTRDYLDSNKRSIANTVQIFFTDGSCTEQVRVDYPIGHRNRRQEGLVVLQEKFRDNASTRFDEDKVSTLCALSQDAARFSKMPVDEFVELWIP